MSSAATMQSVLSRFMATYKQSHTLTPPQATVCHRLGLCRTEALGGQRIHCNQCDFEQERFHSCRNRHCPQCQKQATAQWSEAQSQRILPVPYFHLVFTLPHELNPWIQLHPEVIYALLFKSVWKTLTSFGAQKRRLNGELGMTAVLHTWGQNLSQHVHLHCLVPGGALSESGWHQSKGHYLFPVKALSRHFRGAMVGAIRAAYTAGELNRISEPTQVDKRLDAIMQKAWVVYTQSYLKRPEIIVEYLARYSHKIAISDSRLLNITDKQVTFRWKDYRDHDKRKSMALCGEEFLRRFLLHVLPPGFMRIRHYGFLANCCRERKLVRIRTLLAQPPTEEEKRKPSNAVYPATDPTCPCPKCTEGVLYVIEEIPPKRTLGENQRQTMH